MSVGKPTLSFKDVPGLHGIRKADFRHSVSGQDLQILELQSNVFHVWQTAGPQDPGQTVVIKKAKDVVSALLHWLVDWGPTKPGKTCWTLTTIVEWPDGHTEITHSSGCD
jgi:hypothetical protein